MGTIVNQFIYIPYIRRTCTGATDRVIGKDEGYMLTSERAVVVRGDFVARRADAVQSCAYGEMTCCDESGSLLVFRGEGPGATAGSLTRGPGTQEPVFEWLGPLCDDDMVAAARVLAERRSSGHQTAGKPSAHAHTPGGGASVVIINPCAPSRVIAGGAAGAPGARV